MAQRPTQVVVIGGGITGLAAAHRLRELDSSLEVSILDAAPRLGGVLHTTQQDGFLLEDAADNFITTVPWATDLCRRLGLADQLLPTNSQHRGASVVYRGQLHPIPHGFTMMAPARIGPMLKTPLLSLSGKLRMAAEPLVPVRRDTQDESIASFVQRRLGREVYQRLVQPLVGSIYGSDPADISLLATMPHFAAMEREHGSLYRAMRRKAKKEKSSAENNGAQSSGARYSMFVAPREGMESIVEALAKQLPPQNIHLETPVTALHSCGDGGWSLSMGGKQPRTWSVDGMILATPASTAARLLRDVQSDVAEEMDQIEYSGSILVTLGYDRSAIEHPLDSFGFVVPRDESWPLLSASFTSVKYPGRAPAGKTLIRAFLGGEQLEELLGWSDDELVDLASSQLSQLLDISAAPCLRHVVRHDRAMPRYRVGHLERISRIERGLDQHPTLLLAGAGYHGVGVPHCIHSGEQAAEKLYTQIQKPAQKSPATEVEPSIATQ